MHTMSANMISMHPALSMNATRLAYSGFSSILARVNVQPTMQQLREMIEKGEIGLVDAMYEVSTGKVTFYK